MTLLVTSTYIHVVFSGSGAFCQEGACGNGWDLWFQEGALRCRQEFGNPLMFYFPQQNSLVCLSRKIQVPSEKGPFAWFWAYKMPFMPSWKVEGDSWGKMVFYCYAH